MLLSFALYGSQYRIHIRIQIKIPHLSHKCKLSDWLESGSRDGFEDLYCPFAPKLCHNMPLPFHNSISDPLPQKPVYLWLYGLRQVLKETAGSLHILVDYNIVYNTFIYLLTYTFKLICILHYRNGYSISPALVDYIASSVSSEVSSVINYV